MFAIAKGWLDGVVRQESLNFNQRPLPADISLLVIHNISLPPGEFGGGLVSDFFCNRLDCSLHPALASLQGMTVAAHLFIERDGRTTQFVSFDNRAWHAGVSSFDGRENCNDFSIGIELEGADDQPYTEQQYLQLARVSQSLQVYYPLITTDRITGHSDIAPGRKTDPGPAFDWGYYRSTLNGAEQQT